MPAYHFPRFRQVGTILGDHTSSEVRDLLAAKDVEIAELEAAIASFGPTWAEGDIDAVHAWDDDFAALKVRYQAARDRAQRKLNYKDPILSDDWTPAEGEWNAILDALRKEDGKVSPGDHMDLVYRISDAGAKLSYKVPQPVANDADLRAFLRADAIKKELDAVSQIAGSNLGLIGIGAGIALLAIFLLRR